FGGTAVSASDTHLKPARHWLCVRGFEADLQYGISSAARPQVFEKQCGLLTLCNLLCYIALLSSVDKMAWETTSRHMVMPGWSLCYRRVKIHYFRCGSPTGNRNIPDGPHEVGPRR